MNLLQNKGKSSETLNPKRVSVQRPNQKLGFSFHFLFIVTLSFALLLTPTVLGTAPPTGELSQFTPFYTSSFHNNQNRMPETLQSGFLTATDGTDNSAFFVNPYSEIRTSTVSSKDVSMTFVSGDLDLDETIEFVGHDAVSTRLKILSYDENLNTMSTDASIVPTTTVTQNPVLFDYDSDGTLEVVTIGTSELSFYNHTGNALSKETNFTISGVPMSLRCYNVTGFSGVSASEGLRCGYVTSTGTYNEYLMNGTLINSFNACPDFPSKWIGTTKSYPTLVSNYDNDAFYEISLFCQQDITRTDQEGVELKTFQSNGVLEQYRVITPFSATTACSANTDYAPISLTVLDVENDGVNEILASSYGCIGSWHQEISYVVVDKNNNTVTSGSIEGTHDASNDCDLTGGDACYFDGIIPFMSADIFSTDNGEEWCFGYSGTTTGAQTYINDTFNCFGDDVTSSLFSVVAPNLPTFELNDINNVNKFNSYYSFGNGIQFATQRKVFQIDSLRVTGTALTFISTLPVSGEGYTMSDVNGNDRIDLISMDDTETNIVINGFTPKPPSIQYFERDTGSPTCNNTVITYTMQYLDADSNSVRANFDCFGDGTQTINNSFTTLNTNDFFQCVYNKTGTFTPKITMFDDADGEALVNLAIMRVIEPANGLCFLQGEGGQVIINRADVADPTSVAVQLEEDVKLLIGNWSSGTKIMFAMFILMFLIFGITTIPEIKDNPFIYRIILAIGIIFFAVSGFIPSWVIILLGILTFLGGAGAVLRRFVKGE